MDYHDFSETFRSFGVQLLSDFYVFRIPFMMSGGIEATWRHLQKTPFLKVIFNVDLYGMSIGRRKAEIQR